MKVRLRWFRHVVRIEEDNVIKKALRLVVDRRHSRGRQRIRTRDEVRERHGGGRGWGGRRNGQRRRRRV